VGSAAVSPHEVRELQASLDALSGRKGEVGSIEAAVNPRLSWLGAERQVLTEQIEKRPKGLDGRRNAIGFDAGDRRLRRPRPRRQAGLADAMAAARLTKDLAGTAHASSIAYMYLLRLRYKN
jgi:hypothetical protein